jgi:hypothetical protein
MLWHVVFFSVCNKKYLQHAFSFSDEHSLHETVGTIVFNKRIGAHFVQVICMVTHWIQDDPSFYRRRSGHIWLFDAPVWRWLLGISITRWLAAF